MTSQKTAAEETTGAGGGEAPFHFCNPQKCIESNDMLFNLKPRGRRRRESIPDISIIYQSSSLYHPLALPLFLFGLLLMGAWFVSSKYHVHTMLGGILKTKVSL